MAGVRVLCKSIMKWGLSPVEWLWGSILVNAFNFQGLTVITIIAFQKYISGPVAPNAYVPSGLHTWEILHCILNPDPATISKM